MRNAVRVALHNTARRHWEVLWYKEYGMNQAQTHTFVLPILRWK